GNSPFTYQILIDGKTYDASGKPSSERLSASTSASGQVKLVFTIPDGITMGRGTLALQLPSGNEVETYTQPFRVLSRGGGTPGWRGKPCLFPASQCGWGGRGWNCTTAQWPGARACHPRKFF
ncbi:MAG TPA: hypothetical protein PKD72_14750, partial [Gemmatales bacterium]|nr:hypothetical protein [Gemmatales bacterium]